MKKIFITNIIILLVLCVGVVFELIAITWYIDAKNVSISEYNEPVDIGYMNKLYIKAAIESYINESLDYDLSAIVDERGVVNIKKLAKEFTYANNIYGPYLEKELSIPNEYVVYLEYDNINIYLGDRIKRW